jgi:phosphinothricin acetyltransferase
VGAPADGDRSMADQAPRIRAAEADDLPAIQQIYAYHVLHGTASWELEPPDLAEMRRRWETLVAGGYPYFVMEQGRKLLGYAYAGPYRPRPAYRYTVEDTIYLRQDQTGRGLAAPLLQQLIDACEEAGKRQMVAVIGDSANRASIAFHRRMGFAEVGTVRNIGWKFGRWLDQILMQRPLGRGDGSPPDG